MSSSMLKIIAYALMLIDHMGAALFPEAIILRMIGRLSFPIFSYLIAVGYTKTNSFSKYLRSLFIFGVISQIPFSLAFSEGVSVTSFSGFLGFLVGSPTPHMNIFFTLAIGLIAIRVWDKGQSRFGKIIAILALGIVAQAFSTDYGIYGVAMILAFYIFRDSKAKTVISQTSVFIMFYASQIILAILSYPGISIKLVWFNQASSLLALIFIFTYNGNKGKNLKYFFYAFYPTHLLVIGLIKNFM
ncbi:conjugal transfer protein TraX [Clostridium bowmanii]|uniref:TraX family protein n=1 Tax=Clostridium bowmanii TaxID=132925 RepID=UPI001C0B2A21|nr:TraX family protein [Clostridium bowmanii]MBU3191635.1 conjugal transfer protein TraX [Clostridium bowmanii]MCA1073211.1 conjugal transfer protein TraX [Clostridium bowmanii]